MYVSSFALTGVDDTTAAPMEVDATEGATAAEEKKVSFFTMALTVILFMGSILSIMEHQFSMKRTSV